MADLDILIPDGYDLLVMRWTLPSGRTATCSIGGEPNTVTDIQARADQLFAATVAEWDQITDTNYTFLPSIVYHNAGGAISSAISTAASTPGTAVKATAPCELNVGIRKRTGFIGKGYRGRMYWPIGLNETSVDEGGVINSSTVTAVQNAVTAWAADLVGPTDPWFDFHLFRNPDPDNVNTPRVPVAIQNFDVSPVCTSQRRRRSRA